MQNNAFLQFFFLSKQICYSVWKINEFEIKKNLVVNWNIF